MASKVIAITEGAKVVYSRGSEIHITLLNYRATVVKREWRGKRRVLTLTLPGVRVTGGSGGELYVVFPEFRGAMCLCVSDDPLEIWNIRNGKLSRVT